MSTNVCTPAGEFLQVRVDDLVLSGTNPRKQFDERALQELGESIRQVGVLQPVVVRRVHGIKGFVLVAGERRWRAAVWANVETIPAVVRELSDVQALEVQVLENLQRQDVRPLEEAEGFRALIEAGAYTPDTLAARLGKSRAHVYGRLRLLKLTPEVREALGKGLVEASVGDLVSKFAPEVQSEALAVVLPPSWMDGETVSFRDAKRLLVNFWPDLAAAPWIPKAGEEAVAAGLVACAVCPHASANMPDLVESGDGVNRCMNRACYASKAGSFRETVAAGLRAKGREVLDVGESAKLFHPLNERGGTVELQHGCGFVRAGEKCWDSSLDGEKATTWAQLLKGLQISGVWAITPAGKSVELFRESEARAAAVEAGRLKAGRAAGGADRASVIAANRREREVNGRVGESCVALVSGLSEAQFLRVFLDRARPDWRRLCESQEGEPDKADALELRGWAVRALCWSKSQGWQPHELEAWETVCDLDRAKIGREVDSELKGSGRDKASGKRRGKGGGK